MAQDNPWIYNKDPGGHLVLQWWFNLVAVMQQRAWFRIYFLEDGNEVRGGTLSWALESCYVHANADFGEFAEAACMVNSQSPRGPVPVCVGSSRGWAAVDRGNLCSEGQEDRDSGCALKPHCVQDLLYWMSHLSVVMLLLKASLSIIILSELINFQQY